MGRVGVRDLVRLAGLGASPFVVVETLRTCGLPAAEVAGWCLAILKSDRNGFIPREPLESLGDRYQTIAAR